MIPLTSSLLLDSLLGGLLIGLAAGLVLLLKGSIAGISGIWRGLIEPPIPSNRWKLAFIGGLIVGGGFVQYYWPDAFPQTWEPSFLQFIVAGFLVGVGTAVGNGCTSGHGVCGIGRLSIRSLVATGTFMLSAIVCVWIIRHLLS